MQTMTPSTPRSTTRRVRNGSAAILLVAVWVATTAGRVQPAAPADPAVAVDPAAYQDLRWRNVGPHRGGRVTAIAGVRTRPNVFYMGATGGGVWKTENHGITWRPISDGQIATGSIGAIDVSDSNPDIVYAGTGSAAIRSNVIIGRGMYRSTDAGTTWHFAGLRDAGQIGSVVIHPTNPDIVWVAALGSPYGPSDERGIFKTIDGGASWTRVLFVNAETGGRVVAINWSNPDEVYAGMYRAFRKGWDIVSGGPASEGGLYKSVDGGTTWAKLSAGLPGTLIGKIDLDVARSNPKVVYAMIEAPAAEGGLYRSDDAGETWRIVNNETRLRTRPFYFHYVDVNPRDENEVWVNELRLWKSTDGGRSFALVATPHGDNHGMWFNPDHPAIILQCNDGGANVSLDGGASWSSILNQPTAELYMVSVDERFPYRLYGPQQDNSTVIVPSVPPVAWTLDRPEQIWSQGPGCETGQIHPRPDGRVIFGACKGELGRYDTATGQEQHYWVYPQNRYGHNPRDIAYRFPRQSVILVSPHDPTVIYHASHVVHRTIDDGVTWAVISPDLTAFEADKQVNSGTPITRDITGEEVYSSIYAMAESRLERGVLWAGANDGPVHVSRDGGRTWTDVTPPDLPPGGRVQTIEDSPHRRGGAYIAVYRYLREHDLRPYIYATSNYGETWTTLTPSTSGIPGDHPARVVREDPEVDGLLYAGTEFGIFVSFDHGTRWQSLQQNLPATPVTDLRVHRGDLVIATMGRGFWIMDDVSPLRQMARGAGGVGEERDSFQPGRPHLFQPRAVHRIRYQAIANHLEFPEYPTNGARVDYYLPAAPSGEMTLEIVDGRGAVVRAFTHSTGPRGIAAGQEMRASRRGGTVMVSLPARAGTNRFVWDLRHTGAWQPGGDTAGGGGPLVAPGRYEVRFRAGDFTATRTLEIRIDPRVADAGVTVADLEEQTAFLLKVRDAMGEARRLADRIERALVGTADPSSRTGARARGLSRQDAEVLRGLRARLITAGGPYPQPMLVDQLANLARMLGQGDQKVGRDAYVRFDDLMKEWAEIKARADR
jgi:photosystem II stability/assembly factor-like uncharacterized protein